MRECILKYPNSPVWIAGDYNLPNIDWQNQCTVKHNYPIQLCNILLNFVADFGLTQIVDFPTRATNTLDLFLLIDHL